MINKARMRILIIAISVPIIVALLLEFNLIWRVETDNDWIGFYASYFGSIIGVYGVFEVMRIDQKKRQEERNDELFLNNLEIYRKIALSLNVKGLDELKEKITKLRSEESWSIVDSSTKNKLKRIEGNLYDCNESDGLFYAIRGFVSSNLHEELKITLSSPGDEFNEPFEYEDVLNETLDEFTNAVLRNCNVELVYENLFEVSIEKNKFLESLEKNSYTKGYGDKIDAIYKKLSQIEKSTEWWDYISKRSLLFKQLSELRTYIDTRIEKVLNY
jgi:hypothetical protein